jgi:hypothetical protein
MPHIRPCNLGISFAVPTSPSMGLCPPRPCFSTTKLRGMDCKLISNFKCFYGSLDNLQHLLANFILFGPTFGKCPIILRHSHTNWECNVSNLAFYSDKFKPIHFVFLQLKTKKN